MIGFSGICLQLQLIITPYILNSWIMSVWRISHYSLSHLYSTLSNSKSKLRYGQRLIGQSVLVSSTHLGPKTRYEYLLLSDRCGFVGVGRFLGREDESVIYNYFWPSPAQSFSGLSPEGLMIIFYCLRFETPPTWRARSPYLYHPGTGWLGYTPRHWVLFFVTSYNSHFITAREPNREHHLQEFQLIFLLPTLRSSEQCEAEK
jgi:hypothetical protein